MLPGDFLALARTMPSGPLQRAAQPRGNTVADCQTMRTEAGWPQAAKLSKKPTAGQFLARDEHVQALQQLQQQPAKAHGEMPRHGIAAVSCGEQLQLAIYCVQGLLSIAHCTGNGQAASVAAY